MFSRGDRDRLLLRVRGWFDAPEQVQHYQQEAADGPTPAEAWLLGALPATGRVLDLGCGAGRMSTTLARRGYDVVGADVCPELLRGAPRGRRMRLHARDRAVRTTVPGGRRARPAPDARLRLV